MGVYTSDPILDIPQLMNFLNLCGNDCKFSDVFTRCTILPGGYSDTLSIKILQDRRQDLRVVGVRSMIQSGREGRW